MCSLHARHVHTGTKFPCACVIHAACENCKGYTDTRRKDHKGRRRRCCRRRHHCRCRRCESRCRLRKSQKEFDVPVDGGDLQSPPLAVVPWCIECIRDVFFPLLPPSLCFSIFYCCLCDPPLRRAAWGHAWGIERILMRRRRRSFQRTRDNITRTCANLYARISLNVTTRANYRINYKNYIYIILGTLNLLILKNWQLKWRN